MGESSWDYSIFWKETVNQLKDELTEQEFLMWFKNIYYHASEEEKILLAVPSSFYKDQVKQRYLDIIESKLHELSGNAIKIEMVVSKVKETDKKKSEPQTKKKEPSTITKQKRSHPQLRKEYTFENFIIGENNSFAANASIAIAKNPGKAYNPCLIYGGVGLGKTHLIQSIGHSAYQDFDGIKTVYITAETFTNEFIQSLHGGNMNKFKNKYRNVDILLIDDIHFLQKKTETQEELFHTFNALYEANKQLVFTCDRPVSELKNLSDRLRNRFERGLNVDLQPPNFETRFAILKKKIEDIKVDITDDVIELICNNITTNVRDLESALTKLIAYADLVNKKITLEIAQQQLKDVFSSPRHSNITVEMIQRVVAEYFNLSHNDLRGRKRTKAIVFPRQIAMFIVREMTELSTTEVGWEFGGRDHTTVMHSCQRVENRMRTDPTLDPIIQNLIKSIKDYGTKS